MRRPSKYNRGVGPERTHPQCHGDMAQQSKGNDATSKTPAPAPAPDDDGGPSTPSAPLSAEDRRRQRRSFLAQALACSAKNLILYSYGMALGFISIVIPDLSIGKEGFILSPEEISWFGSSNWLCTALGGLCSGSLSAPLGRRPAMMFVNVVFILSALLFHFANTVPMLFAAQSLTGFAGGLLEGPCLTYIGEIAEPKYRGGMSSTTVTVMIIGIFTDFTLGSVLSWRTLALVNLSGPICALISLMMVPESPHWLMVRGKEKAAEKSLQWLRGWVQPEDVREEVELLKSTLLDKSGKKGLRRGFEPRVLTKRIFLIPYGMIAFIYFGGHWGGMTALQTFAVPIFKQLGSSLNAYLATILIGLFEFFGSLLCVVLLHIFGKRKLTFVSMISSAICFMGAGVWIFATKGVANATTSIGPVALLIASSFFSHLMIRILPWILIGEVYPPEVKGFASGASGATGYILGFSANKTFLWLSTMLGLPGVFLLYSSLGTFAVIVLYFLLPETEGRKLHVILTFFDGTGSLHERGMPKKNKQRSNAPASVAETSKKN